MEVDVGPFLFRFFLFISVCDLLTLNFVNKYDEKTQKKTVFSHPFFLTYQSAVFTINFVSYELKL